MCIFFQPATNIRLSQNRVQFNILMRISGDGQTLIQARLSMYRYQPSINVKINKIIIPDSYINPRLLHKGVIFYGITVRYKADINLCHFSLLIIVVWIHVIQTSFLYMQVQVTVQLKCGISLNSTTHTTLRDHKVQLGKLILIIRFLIKY